MLDILHETIASASRHKVRTGLTAFGVFWGITMFVFLLGLGNGLKNSVEEQFALTAIRRVEFFPWKTTQPYKGQRAGRRFSFTNEDIEVLRRHMQGIAAVVPRVSMAGGADVTSDHGYGSYSVVGTIPEQASVRALQLLEGRFLTERDQAFRWKVVVLGEKARKQLFGSGEALGKSVVIGGLSFKVVGTIRFQVWGDSSSTVGNALYVPLSTVQSVLAQGDRIDIISVIIREGWDVATIEKGVKALLSPRHGIAPGDEFAIDTVNTEEEYRETIKALRSIDVFIWIVGLGTVAAGVVSVGNIMLISVKERTKEFGVRKAVGATPSEIVKLVLFEAIIITSAAGCLGLAGGAAALGFASRLAEAWNIGTDFIKNPQVDAVVVIQSIVILVVTGCLAGTLPALRAARIDPVQALRDE